MSIKGFLEVQEMQEGGPAMFTPFAVDPEGSPRRRIAPTYQPNPPPTIALPPIAPITPTPTEDLTNFSPDPNYMGSIDMTLAQAGADRDNLGPLNPHWSQEFLSTLEARGRPETDLSRTLDRGFKALATPALAVTAALVPGAAPLVGLFSAVTGRGGGGILSSALSSAMGGKPAATTTPAAQTAAYQGTPAATTLGGSGTKVDIFAPGGAMDQARGNMTALGGSGGAANVNIFAPGGAMAQAREAQAAPAAPTAAQIGSEMFGNVYGMGGEISQNFAIGGKGSFTSFSHYGAGISQADEISIVTNAAPGVFDSAADGKDTVDTMVSNGYNEAQITAVAQGELDEGELDSLAQSVGMEDAGVSGGDGGGSPVICTQLFSMGIMSANLYQGEGEHAKNIPNVIRRGYHFWAVPFVRGMRKNQLLFKLGKTLGLSWAQYAAHKANPDKFAPNYLGTVINAIGTPICATLGLFVGETDWETLWIDYEKGNGLCLDQQN